MFNEVFKNHYDSSSGELNVIGINKEVQAAYVWNFFNTHSKSLIVVTNTLYEANSLYKALSFFDASKVLLFPMDDFLVSEAVAMSPDLMAKRIETLNELSNYNDKYIVITNLMGYLRFLPSKTLWNSLKINLSKDSVFAKNELIDKINMMGYKRENIVTKTGEYASRGYIIDIFPYGFDNPVRLEFFDDEIENIRFFDPLTQLSTEKINTIKIEPFTEFINEKGLDISNRQSLLPRVVNKVSKLSEYISDFNILFISLEDIKLAYNNILKEITEFKESDQYNITNYMHDLSDNIPENYINMPLVDNYPDRSNCQIYHTSAVEQFNGNFEKINNYLEKMHFQKKKIIVCLDNSNMISDFKSKVHLKCVVTNPDNYDPDAINIINLKMLNGFIVNEYVFLTTSEIYRKSEPTFYRSKFKYGSKIRDINKLKVGDYVVHFAHGIGRYMGIVTLTSKGLKKDYINIQYHGNDKLYIPVEKIEYISKYSSNESVVPRLNKLSGTDWAKQKVRIKGKVRDIARELLELSAKRRLVKGFPFLKDDIEQYKFEENFEYKPTPDQLKAASQIKEDMEKPHPMDRLLCGDVGYGKTEVAFRAIFKAIKSGKQVAFLCPTTILSKQHYENAVNRFFGFGINIEVLNRFVSSAKKKTILEGLKSGRIDLIIGTHSLLSKNIIYKDLGLLVVDEEQRFGVTHKEKIKEYRNSIDVLTLSATPIPRTLQMSLSGIRGLSLIETPPTDKYPVQTYVLRENNQIIKDAIYKELARDGQVFILYNNVARMEEKVNSIKKLVPEANVTFINGQMSKGQIEKTMEDFVFGVYNILICTTIIETGIDIQNANTLIVIDADHFGLSQLYQIRGRIGRGKNIGYAYLMYNKDKELSDIATKRLDAIKEFTELGSGYALAVRDLAIRGAGDILGSEQSGFIDTIGYDMYLRILNEEVARLKGETLDEPFMDDIHTDEKPFIQVSTHISSKYADNEELKIEIHKKINTIDSVEKLLEVKSELEDRFGRLDEDINVYMLEELFQAEAKKKKVTKVEQTENVINVYFSSEKSDLINGQQLLSELFKISRNFEVSYVNKTLKISLKLKDLNAHYLYYLNKMLNIIE